jgi:glycosyltransferase involved in cell wall biosynthesis
MNKLSISVIIIVKNEADRLDLCLSHLLWAKEIVIINNSSTDNSLDIAKKYHTLIINSNIDSFADLRNLGYQKATGDWIFYVDADEIVSPELAGEIQNTVTKFEPTKTPHSYSIIRQNYYFGNQVWPKNETINRLFWRKTFRGWYGKVHESSKPLGEIGCLRNYLYHFTHRNLTEMAGKTNSWSNIEAELRFKANHPKIAGWRLIRVMITAFWISYINDGGWKIGVKGLIESIYQAFSMFITYAKLWELQND